jgi:hypothetical protein
LKRSSSKYALTAVASCCHWSLSSSSSSSLSNLYPSSFVLNLKSLRPKLTEQRPREGVVRWGAVAPHHTTGVRRPASNGDGGGRGMEKNLMAVGLVRSRPSFSGGMHACMVLALAAGGRFYHACRQHALALPSWRVRGHHSRPFNPLPHALRFRAL